MSLKTRSLQTQTDRMVLSALILFLLAGAVTHAFCAWKRVGFAGREVTAITGGIGALENHRPVVLFAVRDSGVFSVSGPSDSIRKFPPFAYDTNDRPSGIVRSLAMSDDGVTVLAASDSGLFGESMIFSSLPAWKRIMVAGSYSTPVVAVAFKDTSLCIATDAELYRSRSPFNSWTPCSVSKYLPSPTRPAHFTSLALGAGVFAAGSCGPAGSSAFNGVITAGRDRMQWSNTTCIYGACLDSNVYSLATGDNGKLFAGTARGIFWAVEFDTGTWYPMSPQLSAPPLRHIAVAGNSASNNRVLFASTDSGVYLSSQRISVGQWSLSLKIKTNAVAPLPPDSSGAVFAATADGLWKFEPTTPVRGRAAALAACAMPTITGVYSLDGRLLASSSRSKRPTGVYIAAHKNSPGTRGALEVHFTPR